MTPRYRVAIRRRDGRTVNPSHPTTLKLARSLLAYRESTGAKNCALQVNVDGRWEDYE